MKKLIITAALLSIAHTAHAENVGLAQAMDMANGIGMAGKCYVDKAPQSSSGYRAYCTNSEGDPLPFGSINNGAGAPTQYFHIPEKRQISYDPAFVKKAVADQKARTAKPAFAASIMPGANGDDWFNNKGQVTRVSRNWVDKNREPAKDNGTFRLAIEKVILNGEPAVRVFETHGYPVCGKGICAVNIDQYLEHIVAEPSYFTTLRGAMQPGNDNDAYIIDEEVTEILWDAPYYRIMPLSASKQNVRAIFDTRGFRAKHPAPRVIEVQ